MDGREIIFVDGPKDGEKIFVREGTAAVDFPTLKYPGGIGITTYYRHRDTDYYVLDKDKVKTYMAFVHDDAAIDGEAYAKKELNGELDRLGVDKVLVLHESSCRADEGTVYRFDIYIYEGAEKVPKETADK